MNVTELKLALPVLIKHRITPFIWGQQGIGKTSIVKQYAKDNDMKFVHLHLATQEVGDLVGLLVHNKDGTVSHARPQWFPTEGKGIIFLDELNRMSVDVMSAIFSFITEKTIHTHVLPEGWAIVAAGNYQSNAFNVTDTNDSAWMSRFCHIDFKPTHEEFCFFAEKQEAYSVADFIRTHRDMLRVEHKERLDYNLITPDPRSLLDMIGKLENEESIDPIRFELYSGILGQVCASTFITFKKKNQDRISGMHILNNFDKFKEKVIEFTNPKHTRFDMINSAFDEIVLYIENNDLSEKQMNNLKSFILTVNNEFKIKIIKKISSMTLWKQRNDIINNADFNKKITKELKTKIMKEKTIQNG